MNAACPSDLALEAYLLSPERSKVAPHLDACEDCRGRVARMQEEGDEFRQYVFPATVGAIEEAVRPRRRWSLLFAPLGALVAAAAALLVVVPAGPHGPGPDYVGTKGLGFAAFVNGVDGAHVVEDGAVVPASGELRFTLDPSGPCHLWIVSVDAKGEVSRLYPPEGAASGARTAGPIPGGAVLDGQPGPERLFAVCAGEKASWYDVSRAASTAKGGPDAVRRAHALGAPLANAPQSTLLLEKRP